MRLPWAQHLAADSDYPRAGLRELGHELLAASHVDLPGSKATNKVAVFSAADGRRGLEVSMGDLQS